MGYEHTQWTYVWAWYCNCCINCINTAVEILFSTHLYHVPAELWPFALPCRATEEGLSTELSSSVRSSSGEVITRYIVCWVSLEWVLCNDAHDVCPCSTRTHIWRTAKLSDKTHNKHWIHSITWPNPEFFFYFAKPWHRTIPFNANSSSYSFDRTALQQQLLTIFSLHLYQLPDGAGV